MSSIFLKKKWAKSLQHPKGSMEDRGGSDGLSRDLGILQISREELEAEEILSKYPACAVLVSSL